MDANQQALSEADFACDLVTAVTVDAARDASRVVFFLDALGLEATPEKPMSLPSRFLLQLGAALRLLDWEAQGFSFHRAVGLPEAREVIRHAFGSLNDSTVDWKDLCVCVLRLSLERFAWHGWRDLAADVAVDDLDDDAALDALAEYLWATRHAGPVTDDPQP